MGKFEGTLNKIHINPLLTIVHRRTPTAWAVINGITILVALQKAVSVFPKAVFVEIGLETFVIILYNEWKERILKKGQND